MSGAPRPSLAALPHWVRDCIRTIPDRWRAWRGGFQQAGGFSRHGPVVRVVLLLLLLAAVIAGINALIRLVAVPDGRSLAERASRTATLYVACTNAECLAAHTAHEPMDFKDWPLPCEQCGQQTVYRASICPACRHWFACRPDMPASCPLCAQARQAATKAAQPASRPLKDPDDAEDSW